MYIFFMKSLKPTIILLSGLLFIVGTDGMGMLPPVSKNMDKCPSLQLIQFRIMGKIKTKQSSREPKYQLKLHGIMQNKGLNYNAPLGELYIYSIPQGARKKIIKKLAVKKISKNQRIIIAGLSEPLFSSTQFLPQYQLIFKPNRNFVKSCKSTIKNKSLLKGKLINRNAVKRAL